MSTETAAAKMRGRPFSKGLSGNPAGKPQGTHHRATLLAEMLMSDDLESVVQAVVSQAKSDDMSAARIILERLAPVHKGRPVEIELPPINADVLVALGAAIKATAEGGLTPEEAGTFAGVLDAKRRALEKVEIESRIAVLEKEQVR